MANLIISKPNSASVYISILKLENHICKNDNSHLIRYTYIFSFVKKPIWFY